jgi:heavy metal sensor kinase
MVRSLPSIRRRLAAWYTVALAVMLVLYASASFLLVRHALVSQVDELLEDDLSAARSAVRLSGDGQVSWRPESYTATDSSDDRGEDVWLPSGAMVHRSSATASLRVESRVNAGVADLVDGKGLHWRTRTGTVQVGAAAAVVRVARSTDDLRDELFELGIVLVGGVPVMLLLAGVAGSVLAGRLLQPIDQLARDAERITADRLHERLRAQNPDDEIGRLTAVINGAFERIGFAFEQLRRFTADASHELRTPLTVVRGIGEATLGHQRTVPEYQDAIGSMLEEVDRMTHLVNALLRLTNADAGAVKVRESHIDLLELARNVAASLNILAEEKQQRFAVNGDNVHVRADPVLIREAVINVVHNAVKYSPVGSVTQIDVSREGSRGHITVRDQGPGVGPQDRQRIFDRFFRVDEARSRESGGSGLGLAIAKWAIEANDGTIMVDDAPGGGASFRITLPLSPAHASAVN